MRGVAPGPDEGARQPCARHEKCARGSVAMVLDAIRRAALRSWGRRSLVGRREEKAGGKAIQLIAVERYDQRRLGAPRQGDGLGGAGVGVGVGEAPLLINSVTIECDGRVGASGLGPELSVWRKSGASLARGCRCDAKSWL
ncbi:hypothetical protein S7711_11192 [Stachybotrys chartarum IBT 7711]|uniref:Uncharacterized protein n=1 Tax=Stachybotrys chartarum (strain CBS 109288 / IBT 7711) TaxID=1280523 RepID=A0A084ASN0_STACB|nr:hypothetical protein S7711_11192 [Stachybotrys chartarum IBT 7711]KFA76733.1 hypothetical protein S40288_11555 [Stachybotrys chartarum IBT 40288]